MTKQEFYNLRPEQEPKVTYRGRLCDVVGAFWQGDLLYILTEYEEYMWVRYENVEIKTK